MPTQTTRQQARRVALDAQARMREARAAQERRRSAWAVTVVTALAERDAQVRLCEARAGSALRAMTKDEGLTLREAAQWCGGDEQLTVREATRLWRMTDDVTEGGRSVERPKETTSSASVADAATTDVDPT